MIRILFICHGNICRSPMAEFILKNIIRTEGREHQFEVASAATSREEIGNDMYPPAKNVLKKHEIPYEKRSARQITAADLEYYDHVIIMEGYNMMNLRKMFPDKDLTKVRLLMSYTGRAEDVSDPWYTGDFDKAYADIYKGCCALLKGLKFGSETESM